MRSEPCVHCGLPSCWMEHGGVVMCRLCMIRLHGHVQIAYPAEFSPPITQATAPFVPVALPPPRGRCASLGEDTGERRLCDTCKGKVSLKVLACAVHGACTVEKPVGVACCATCGDWVVAT